MKRVICVFLAFLILAPVYGCQHRNHNENYVFYYPRNDYGYNVQEGKFYENIIASEIRDNFLNETVSEIISVYLNGPISQNCSNPYPENLSLESFSTEDQTLYITVSDHLSELTGIRLMIACACLGKTGMELTNTTSVQISCRKAMLDGKKSVTLHYDQIIVNDSVPAAAYEQE